MRKIILMLVLLAGCGSDTPKFERGQEVKIITPKSNSYYPMYGRVQWANNYGLVGVRYWDHIGRMSEGTFQEFELEALSEAD